MFYKLFGWLVRWQACKMTALAIHGHKWDGELGHHAWSLTILFEQYMITGADGTMDDFGPKEPINLTVVEKDKNNA